MRRIVLQLLVLLIAALPARRPLLAEEQAPLATDEDRAMLKAQKLRAQGDALYQGRDFQGALGRYKEAYLAFQSPLLLVSIAAAYERLSDVAGALSSLLRFFANPGDSVEVVVNSAERSFTRLWEAAPPGLREALARKIALEHGRTVWERFPEQIRSLLPRQAEGPRPLPPRAGVERPARVKKQAPAASMGPRDRPMTLAKWLLGSAGLLAAAAGGALLGVDGYCVDEFSAGGDIYCREAFQGNAAGITLLVGGGVALGISGLLFGLDHRSDRALRRLSGVGLLGRF